MEVEGIEQTSPLIKKIIGLKIRKLNTDSLNDIITRARNMTKLTLPSGCSQNLKAEFQDPEKALEYSKRKNRIFESYLQNELGKLNCKKSPIEHSKISKKTVKQNTSSPSKMKKDQVKETKTPTKQIKKPVNAYTPEVSKKQFSSIESFFITNTSKDQIALPPLVKSIPLYLDPNYRFHKKNASEEISRLEQLKHIRVKSLDEVSTKCDEFLPSCKNNLQELHEFQCANEEKKKIISTYMEDFSDCLKMSKDQKTFEDSMSTRMYNRKLDQEFISELPELKQSILQVTKNVIDIGGQKI